MTAKDYFIHWIGSFLGFDQTMTLDDRQVQEIREQLQLVYDEEKVENRKHIPLPNPQKYVKDDRDPYKTTDPIVDGEFVDFMENVGGILPDQDGYSPDHCDPESKKGGTIH